MFLDELSNAEIIKRIKLNPVDKSPEIAEMFKRLDDGAFSDTDLINLIDVLATIKYGGD